jgi:hypothetical protein
VGCRKLCISINQIMKAHFFLKNFIWVLIWLHISKTKSFKWLEVLYISYYIYVDLWKPFKKKNYLLHLNKRKKKCMSKLGFVRWFGVKKLFLVLEHLFYNFMWWMVGKDIVLRPWRPRFSSWYQHLLYTYGCTLIYIGGW